MSPALVGLSSGDISGMAYNMQVVFATTVVGLVVSAIGLVTLQFKQRWYAKEVFSMDYIAQILSQNNDKNDKHEKCRRRISRLRTEEYTDPLSVVVNLFDVAMVFAVALMVAMVMHMNMTEVFSKEDFPVVKNPREKTIWKSSPRKVKK